MYPRVPNREPAIDRRPGTGKPAEAQIVSVTIVRPILIPGAAHPSLAFILNYDRNLADHPCAPFWLLIPQHYTIHVDDQKILMSDG
jgi:hypothetical protein